MTSPTATVTDDELFDMRWRRAEPDSMAPLERLYGGLGDVGALRDRLRAMLAEKWAERPADLRRLDMERDLDPEWFLHQRMVGYVFYVDRFAGTVADVPARTPWLRDLGVTYAHFMPCLAPRPGDSDGGYAVMDYGAIDPALGTMDDLRAATAELRAAGISTCIDMVLNHTAKEHDWGRRAAAGDAHYRAFYRMFDDAALPRAYERTLVEVFPDQAPGNFTHYPDMGGPEGTWVWTTFNEFQWDLNWENPDVFLAVLGVILDLANAGAEVMRLDAVAFMWKRMGTGCQNLPEVHDILQAINQATSIAAPAVIHKAEAIVGPNDLVPYLGQGRHSGRVCNLAYHNNLMVQFWSSLAARDTVMMTDVLARHFPPRFRHATWATYLRCHDDIGWAITEADAERHGLSGPGHRGFLAGFYRGDHPGSFARGADFQVNDETGDRRTNGTLASLAGLEAAVAAGDAGRIDDAVARIVMGHALIAAYGGIPLIYMGDEIGLTNDASDPRLADDGRWMHRPPMDWALAERAAAGEGPEGRILAGLRHIMAVRATLPQLSGDVATWVVDAGDSRLFAVRRPGDDGPLLAVFNFAEAPASVGLDALGLDPGIACDDALSGRSVSGALHLPPYGAAWLVPRLTQGGGAEGA